MAAPVVIRVGCALDTSVEKSFRDFERRSQLAAKRAGDAMAKGGRTRRASGDDAMVAAARTSERKVTQVVQTEGRRQLQEWRKIIKERIAANKNYLEEMKMTEARATSAVLAEERKRERAAKASASRSARELDRFATRTSHRSTRFLMPNAPLASMGRRALSDVMRGIGVDASISGAVGRSTGLQRSTAALSTAGYIAGAQGPAGTRVAAGTLQAEARDLSGRLGIDPQEIVEANAQYVKLTGNLAEARSLQEELARLAIASGASFADTAQMAGEMSNALGDMDPAEKRKAIIAGMRSGASGGKVGSVEQADFARYFAHVGGTAGKFAGPRAETMSKLMALVQIAKSYGGATNAAVATRSIAGLGNTLGTQARVAEFGRAGVDVYTDKKRTRLRDPIEILKDSIRASGGDQVKLKKMWANVIGSKPVEGLANIYNQAGGGSAGMAAIDKAISKQMNAASFTDEAINEAVAKHLETTAAKAQKFQNQLDKIVDTAASKLIPALEKLAPQALKLADSLGRLVTWAAENPGQAIVKAIVFSIARAGLESAGRAAIERAIFTIFNGIRPPMGGGGLLPPIGGTGAPAGAAGAGRGAAGAAGGAAGGALYSAGVASIPAAAGAFLAWDSYNSLQGNRRGGANQTGADEGLDSWANFLTGGVVGAIGSKLGGASWEESAMQLTHAKIGKGAWEAGSWMFGGAGAKAPSFMTDFTGEDAANKAAKEERSRMDAELAKLTASNEAVQRAVSGTLNVNIVSDATARSSPTTNPAGREPPGS